MQRFLHTRATREIDVEIVEHDQIHPAVHAGVGVDIRLDGRRREQRTISARDRDVDVRERAHHLRLAVFEELEVAGAQVGDRLPRRVADEGIDFNEVCLDAERERRLFRLLGDDPRRDQRPGDEQAQEPAVHT